MSNSILGTIDVGGDGIDIILSLLGTHDGRVYQKTDFVFSNPEVNANSDFQTNSVILMQPKASSGYYAIRKVYYNRVNIGDYSPLSINSGEITTETTLHEILPIINDKYGIFIQPSDVEDAVLPQPDSGGNIAVDMVFTASSVIFYGGATLEIPSIPTTGVVEPATNIFLFGKNNSTSNLNITAFDDSLNFWKNKKAGTDTDFTKKHRQTIIRRLNSYDKVEYVIDSEFQDNEITFAFGRGGTSNYDRRLIVGDQYGRVFKSNFHLSDDPVNNRLARLEMKTTGFLGSGSDLPPVNGESIGNNNTGFFKILAAKYGGETEDGENIIHAIVTAKEPDEGYNVETGSLKGELCGYSYDFSDYLMSPEFAYSNGDDNKSLRRIIKFAHYVISRDGGTTWVPAWYNYKSELMSITGGQTSFIVSYMQSMQYVFPMFGTGEDEFSSNNIHASGYHCVISRTVYDFSDYVNYIHPEYNANHYMNLGQIYPPTMLHKVGARNRGHKYLEFRIYDSAYSDMFQDYYDQSVAYYTAQPDYDPATLQDFIDNLNNEINTERNDMMAAGVTKFEGLMTSGITQPLGLYKDAVNNPVTLSDYKNNTGSWPNSSVHSVYFCDRYFNNDAGINNNNVHNKIAHQDLAEVGFIYPNTAIEREIAKDVNGFIVFNNNGIFGLHHFNFKNTFSFTPGSDPSQASPVLFTVRPVIDDLDAIIYAQYGENETIDKSVIDVLKNVQAVTHVLSQELVSIAGGFPDFVQQMVHSLEIPCKVFNHPDVKWITETGIVIEKNTIRIDVNNIPYETDAYFIASVPNNINKKYITASYKAITFINDNTRYSAYSGYVSPQSGDGSGMISFDDYALEKQSMAIKRFSVDLDINSTVINCNYKEFQNATTSSKFGIGILGDEAIATTTGDISYIDNDNSVSSVDLRCKTILSTKYGDHYICGDIGSTIETMNSVNEIDRRFRFLFEKLVFSGSRNIESTDARFFYLRNSNNAVDIHESDINFITADTNHAQSLIQNDQGETLISANKIPLTLKYPFNFTTGTNLQNNIFSQIPNNTTTDGCGHFRVIPNSPTIFNELDLFRNQIVSRNIYSSGNEDVFDKEAFGFGITGIVEQNNGSDSGIYLNTSSLLNIINKHDLYVDTDNSGDAIFNNVENTGYRYKTAEVLNYGSDYKEPATATVSIRKARGLNAHDVIIPASQTLTTVEETDDYVSMQTKLPVSDNNPLSMNGVLVRDHLDLVIPDYDEIHRLYPMIAMVKQNNPNTGIRFDRMIVNRKTGVEDTLSPFVPPSDMYGNTYNPVTEGYMQSVFPVTVTTKQFMSIRLHFNNSIPNTLLVASSYRGTSISRDYKISDDITIDRYDSIFAIYTVTSSLVTFVAMNNAGVKALVMRITNFSGSINYCDHECFETFNVTVETDLVDPDNSSLDLNRFKPVTTVESKIINVLVLGESDQNNLVTSNGLYFDTFSNSIVAPILNLRSDWAGDPNIEPTPTSHEIKFMKRIDVSSFVSVTDGAGMYLDFSYDYN